MAVSAPKRELSADVRMRLLAATETCIREFGYAGLSTRRVADVAGVPLSQIHYHFGSKEGLVLALLQLQDERLISRQRAMFAESEPLWKRWQKACDFLDDDFASGYVLVLQEMIAAGWSNKAVATQVQRLMRRWHDLLTTVATEAGEKLGGLGPFAPNEVASLIAHAFLGGEATLLLGMDDQRYPTRQALRKFGELLRQLEEG
ncbi:MAG: TetR/AcrR family transcriptional regulator [Burkholderiales bacterium]